MLSPDNLMKLTGCVVSVSGASDDDDSVSDSDSVLEPDSTDSAFGWETLFLIGLLNSLIGFFSFCYLATRNGFFSLGGPLVLPFFLAGTTGFVSVIWSSLGGSCGI